MKDSPQKLIEIQTSIFGDYQKELENDIAKTTFLNKSKDFTENNTLVNATDPHDGVQKNIFAWNVKAKDNRHYFQMMADRIVVSFVPNQPLIEIDIANEIKNNQVILADVASAFGVDREKKNWRVAIIVRTITETGELPPELPDFITVPQYFGSREDIDNWSVAFSRVERKQPKGIQEDINRSIEFQILYTKTSPRRFALLKHHEFNTSQDDKTPRFSIDDFDTFKDAVIPSLKIDIEEGASNVE